MMICDMIIHTIDVTSASDWPSSDDFGATRYNQLSFIEYDILQSIAVKKALRMHCKRLPGQVTRIDRFAEFINI